MENDNYKKLQEMLPDYVFDRLDKSEKLFFESNIKNYPDLLEEIEQVNAVFKRFDKMEFEDKINHRARNFSVKVIDKREKRQSYKFSGGQYLTRFLAPTAILIAIGMFYFGSPRFQKNDITKEIDKQLSIISDSLENENIATEVLKNVESYSTEAVIANNLDNVYEEEVSEALNEMIDITEVENIESFETDIFSAERILKTVNNLNEDEFQEIYEELKNVKLID